MENGAGKYGGFRRDEGGTFLIGFRGNIVFFDKFDEIEEKRKIKYYLYLMDNTSDTYFYQVS